ncbi:hypothetical protein ABT173_29915 [Streptomyces sp. NPDC001795]|uniref:hypothetical protein n=1 Tax=unclassified Streptomyces TaxID=2593676 RepID=UPI0033341830
MESRAASLIPPRTTAEARALAEAGPLVLELLPGPEGLTDAEARAVVVAASLIGTDAAIPVPARFRSHSALPVRAQLTWTWHRCRRTCTSRPIHRRHSARCGSRADGRGSSSSATSALPTSVPRWSPTSWRSSSYATTVP